MPDFGRTLIFLGIALIVAGLLVTGFARLHLPLGGLPGDINLRGGNWSFSFPIVSCLVVSAVLSLIFWLLARLKR